ncbi:SEC12-like protein 1, partial [Camellia lanceoleosa]
MLGKKKDKWFELDGQEANIKLVAKELVHLQGAGLQKCLSFSVDGSRFASGGVIILDEPRAHNSFQDMDFRLEFLATTSTDGSARIWKTNDGVPLTSLTRNSKIELCRFSKDGTKPFLFCTIQKANRAVTAVWDMSTWNRIGHKRLLKKPASIMSISLDGKYLALHAEEYCYLSLLALGRQCWQRPLPTRLEQIVLFSSSPLWGHFKLIVRLIVSSPLLELI